MDRRPTMLIALLCTLTVSCATIDEPVAPRNESVATSVVVAAIGAASPFVLAADLTPAAFAPQGKAFRLASCNSTAPAVPYKIELLDGQCYAVVPTVRVATYGGRFYLVPADAKFARDKYGYFCGSSWGWPTNSARAPLADGGTDRACRQHDQGWSAPAGKQPSAFSVRAADKALLASLRAVRPVWQYETDYVAAAIRWIECRVKNNMQYTGSGICLVPAVVRTLNAGVLR